MYGSHWQLMHTDQDMKFPTLKLVLNHFVDDPNQIDNFLYQPKHVATSGKQNIDRHLINTTMVPLIGYPHEN